MNKVLRGKKKRDVAFRTGRLKSHMQSATSFVHAVKDGVGVRKIPVAHQTHTHTHTRCKV